MKTKILLLAALATALATLAASPRAEARGYECTYRTAGVPGVRVTIDGIQNQRELCTLFRTALKGIRVATHPGKVYCGFAMRGMDVRLTVRSTRAFEGLLICSLMAKGLAKDPAWRRIS
jgi:hypothetical protein